MAIEERINQGISDKDFKPDEAVSLDSLVSTPQEGGISDEEFRVSEPQQAFDIEVSSEGISDEDFVPDSITSTEAPLLKDEPTVGDVWQRGYANLIDFMGGDTFNFLDNMIRNPEEFIAQLPTFSGAGVSQVATSLATSGAKVLKEELNIGQNPTFLKNIADYFYAKGNEIRSTAAPSTLPEVKSAYDLLSWDRAYQALGEGAPTVLGIIASNFLTKGAGAIAGLKSAQTAKLASGVMQFLMTAGEGGGTLKTIEEWEDATGKKVDAHLKSSLPIVVGVINGALERVGLESWLKNYGVKGLRKRVIGLMISNIIEPSTEVAQEITQIAAEVSYGNAPDDIGKRLMESAYGGLVLSLAGGGPSLLPGGEPIDKRREPDGAVKLKQVIETSRSPEVPRFEEVQDVKETPKGKSIPARPQGVVEGIKKTQEAHKIGSRILDSEVDAWRAKIEQKSQEFKEFIPKTDEDYQKQADMSNELSVMKEALGMKLGVKVEYSTGDIQLEGEVFETLRDNFKGTIRGISNEQASTLAIVAQGIANYTGKSLDQVIRTVFYGGVGQNIVDWSFNSKTEQIKIKNILSESIDPKGKKVKMKETFTLNELIGKLDEKLSDQDRAKYQGILEEIYKTPEGLSDGSFQYGDEIGGLTSAFRSKSKNKIVDLYLTFFESANPSVALHELGHVLHWNLNSQDLSIANTWLSLDTKTLPHEWTKNQREQFANSFVEYLQTQQAPNKHLESIFEKLKNMLKDMWLTFKIRADKGQMRDLNPEMIAFFDKVLTATPVQEGWKEFEMQDHEIESRMKNLTNQEKINFSKLSPSAWDKYFENIGPKPVEGESKFGNEKSGELMGNPPVRDSDTPPPGDLPESLNEEYGEIEYKLKKKIPWLLKRIFSPEFLLRKTQMAVKDTVNIIEGESWLNHVMRDYESWMKDLMGRGANKMSKSTQEAIIPAMELKYKIKDPATSEISRLVYRKQLDAMMAKHPRLKRALDGRQAKSDGTTTKGGFIEMFEHVKTRMQDSLMERLRIKLSPEQNQVVDEILLQKENLDKKALSALYETLVDVEAMVDVAMGRKKTGAKKSRRNTKKAILRKEIGKLIKEARAIQEVSNWGVRDYITHIELGSYAVLDEAGRHIAFGRTLKEARAKAFEIRKELKLTGEHVGKLVVEQTFSSIDPTKKTKDVLKGEKNIFDVMPRYLYAMEKRIILQPRIDQYKENAKANPEEYSSDVKEVINNQIAYVTGAKYSWGDMIYDDIAVGFGWEPGGYSRGVARARKITANLKLGYRPTAAFVNLTGGLGNTWVAVGTKMFTKGSLALKTGEYTGPDGVTVSIKDMLKDIEETVTLGIDLAVAEGGEISSRTSLWKPLGLFQLPEQLIRPHSFASNYIYAREVLGQNHDQAIESGIAGVRYQQFSYNLSAIPQILRSPTGKLVGQFKTYFIKELEYMSTLRQGQITRMIGMQVALAGPRGVLYALKSIPILMALGFGLDDLEELILKQDVSPVLTRGVAGLAGADISAQAVMQLPNEAKDVAGSFLGMVFDLFDKAVIPAMKFGASKVVGVDGPSYGNLKEGGVDWLKSLSPITGYYSDLLESVFPWETQQEVTKDMKDRGLSSGKSTASGVKYWMETLQRPSVWITDSRGNKYYKVGGLHDRFLLAIGAMPIAKSQVQVARRIQQRDKQVYRENVSGWYKRTTKAILKNDQEEIKNLMEDGAQSYNISFTTLEQLSKFKVMTNQQRETLRANVLNQADTFDRFEHLDE